MPYISLNQTQYFYEIEGDGDPIVLMGGIAQDSSYLKDTRDELKKDFQVITFDPKGIGQTKGALASLNLEEMALDTKELLDALNLKKPKLLGYSMGSCLVQVMAKQFKGAFDKIFLVSTTPKFRQSTLLYFQSFLHLKKQNASLSTLIDLHMAMTYGEQFLLNKEAKHLLKEDLLHNKHPVSIENFSRQLSAITEFDGLKVLKEIENEALIIQGKEDLLCMTLESQYMAAHMKNASYIELNTAHAIIKEAPQILARIVGDFIYGKKTN
jgi:pimeloyl-ACP methyl ester carboxylesterase